MEISVHFIKLCFKLHHLWCQKAYLCKIVAINGGPLTACQRKLSHPAEYGSCSQRICRVISDVMLQQTKLIKNKVE